MKKIEKQKQVIIILVGIFVLILGLLFISYRNVVKLVDQATGNTTEEAKIPYKLRKNPTEIQVKYYEELEEAFLSEEQDDLLISGLVAQNFIADFFTFSNKEGSFDVGGVDYLYAPDQAFGYLQAKDQFYYNFDKHIKKFKEESLEVESVEIIEVVDYGRGDTDGKIYDEYKVSANINYVNNKGFRSSDFETIIHIKLIINDDGRYEITRTYGEE